MVSCQEEENMVNQIMKKSPNKREKWIDTMLDYIYNVSSA